MGAQEKHFDMAFQRAACLCLITAIMMVSALAISAEAITGHDVEDSGLSNQSSYTEDVQSGVFETRAEAIADFRQLCQAAEARLLRPVIKPLVVSSICENEVENGGFTSKTFAYKGQLNVLFSKPITFESELIVSGLFESSPQASSEWTIRCQNWLTKYKNSPRRLLVEECGKAKTEKLGVTSTGQALWIASSRGLRIFDLKSAYQINHSCYCRQSATFKDYIDKSTGKPSRAYFEKYDLMYLDHQGYYRGVGAFSLYHECQDAAYVTKICQEQ